MLNNIFSRSTYESREHVLMLDISNLQTYSRARYMPNNMSSRSIYESNEYVLVLDISNL